MAGLPPTTPGVTVNRLCASGLQAVTDAARAISCGEGELYIAGGVESMSRAPYVFAKSETPYGRDVKLYDSTIGSRFTNPKFRKLYGDHQMPETGDNVAKEFGVTREQADEFALASQKKYARAESEGFYKGEIMAIALPAKKKDAPPAMVDVDEHPRRDSTMASSPRGMLPASTTAPRRSSSPAASGARKTERNRWPGSSRRPARRWSRASWA
jgi:acetyl-CoA C-acetyltransferase